MVFFPIFIQNTRGDLFELSAMLAQCAALQEFGGKAL
jgi:hypothetical protein